LLLLATCLLSGGAAAESRETWLLVDTDNLTLSVMRGEAVLRTFDNIAIGSNGATRHKRAGDEKTPLGEFRITAIRGDSRFHRFLAIDYPTLEDARRGLGDGRISRDEYDRVRRAWESGGVPPQDTSLGGHLGIHGIGAGDPAVHDAFNWTNGCIALTDIQVEELLQWVRVGTRVSVRQPPLPGGDAN
jgi:murein L,D-transpeptidase YafK